MRDIVRTPVDDSCFFEDEMMFAPNAVIAPEETRTYLAHGSKIARSKGKTRPARKHDILPVYKVNKGQVLIEIA